MSITPDKSGAFHPSTLEESVLATLGFFALFQYPLTREELLSNLLQTYHPSFRAESERSEDEARQSPPIVDLETIITELLGNGAIITDGNSYTLPGHEADFERRSDMAPTLRRRLARVRRYAPLLRHVPFVRGAFLCNNLAFGITTEKGDIDLLIVTEPGHIFTARFLCTALFHLLGIRRHGRQTTDRFCLSFYVTSNNLDFSTFALHPQDIYLAYWTHHLVPCFPSNVTGEIAEVNRKWLQKGYGMVQLPDGNPPLSHRGPGLLRHLLELPFRTATGRRIETGIATYQKRKLTHSSSTLPDASGTVISDTMLKFHDRDRRREYQNEWRKKHDETGNLEPPDKHTYDSH